MNASEPMIIALLAGLGLYLVVDGICKYIALVQEIKSKAKR